MSNNAQMGELEEWERLKLEEILTDMAAHIVNRELLPSHAINAAKAALQTYISQHTKEAVEAARADQIELDFLAYHVELDVDESELIAVRDKLQAELTSATHSGKGGE